MDDGLTRREILAASAVALAVPATLANATPGTAATPEPRRRERLTNWRFHLGHAADVEKDFGFGRDQRTFAKAGQAAEAGAPKFDDSGWYGVVVAHYWAVVLRLSAGSPVKGSDRGHALGFNVFRRQF